MEKQTDVYRRESWFPMTVRSFVVILLTSVAAYKIVMTPFDFQFDFPTLLSLLLAFFSVGLAAMFYFKATETSNTFYDNTYKFSQDVGALLSRMESGFGERLKHLDDSYTSMRDQLQNYPPKPSAAEAKQEIKEEQKELQRKLQERDKMINELVTRAQMQDDEKKEFLKQLNDRQKQLEDAKQEMALLQRHFRHIQSEPEPPGIPALPEGMRNYIRTNVLKLIDRDLAAEAPSSLLRRRFAQHKDNFHKAFLADMKEHELMSAEDELTTKGVRIIRAIARAAD